ncbi:MAG: four-carbon acid sugar kinase family protein [Paracoccaceae bacterium]
MTSAEQIRLSVARPRLVIVADDLTGALDAAAPFADKGMKVRVATCPDALATAIHDADVLAVSTRSREIAADAARDAVARVVAAVPSDTRLFKKVDSRLKGNIAAELAAFAPGPVLAVPALPDFGRLVKDGMVCGFGVDRPLSVAAVLGQPARIPDIETAEDMARAIRSASGHLIVGARGAAQAMAAEMANGQANLPRLQGPMLIAVGSTDPITLGQVDAIRAGLLDLRYISAPDGQTDALFAPDVTLVQVVQGSGATGAQVAAALGRGIARLARDAKCLVLTGGATAEAALDALAVHVLDLHGDIQPGLPLSTGGGWRIVTKSGGFGDRDALLRLARRING